MLKTAEFGALATIDTWPFGPQSQGIFSPRDKIQLACEARHPEGMNDIDRLKSKADGFTHGDVKLVRRLEYLRLIVIGINELPPPLLGPDNDRHIGVSTAVQGAGRIETCHGEDADDERSGSSGRRNGDRHRPLRAIIRARGVVPAGHQRECQKTHHGEPNDGSYPRNEDDQVLKRNGRFTMSVEYRLRSAAPGKHDQ